MKVSEIVKAWLTNNKIEAESGTWLHTVAKYIHGLAKLTALLPQPKLIHPKQVIKMSEALRGELENKRANYFLMAKTKDHLDHDNFINTQHCDSTLFSGLLSSTIPVIMSAARSGDGSWHRRPISNPCYPNHSGSSFSRDMMLGLLWWLNCAGSAHNAEETYRYFSKHDFVMGRGVASRLIMMPALEATLAEICARKGGIKRWWARRQLQVWSKDLKDYQIHLSVCHILLRGELMGGISSVMLKSLEYYSDQNPENPLYAYAVSRYTSGECSGIAKLLLNENLWPKDRLPTSADRRSDWITQRDYGDDWFPSKDSGIIEHSGGDFLHVAGLLLKL